MRSQVTLREVAKELNLSIATVSLALRNDPRVKEATRELVQAAASRLGYRADLVGSMMRSKKSRVLGVVATINQELHAAYIEAIVKAAESRNYWVITETVSSKDKYQRAFERLGQLRVDKIIAINPPENLLAVPAVVIGQVEEENACDTVTSDNLAGMTALTKHLADLGHRKVAYLSGPNGVSNREREAALLTAAQGQKIEVVSVAAGDNIDAGYRAVIGMLAEQWPGNNPSPQSQKVQSAGPDSEEFLLPRPVWDSLPRTEGKTRSLDLLHGCLGQITALVCYNDQCAQGAMLALWKAGVRIPNEISVTGFDNSSLASSEVFGMTSVDRDVNAVACMAVNQAIERSLGSQEPPTRKRVDTKLVVRRSTERPFFLDGAGINF